MAITNHIRNWDALSQECVELFAHLSDPSIPVLLPWLINETPLTEQVPCRPQQHEPGLIIPHVSKQGQAGSLGFFLRDNESS
jgi:hypothetical protein